MIFTVNLCNEFLVLETVSWICKLTSDWGDLCLGIPSINDLSPFWEIENYFYKSNRQEVFCKKGLLRNFAKLTGKHLCQACNFIKTETLAQVFSCEFSEISKSTFFKEYIWATASIKHTQDGYLLFVFFYFQVACNCSNSSKQEVKHSYYNLSMKGEKYQLHLSKLLMSWVIVF